MNLRWTAAFVTLALLCSSNMLLALDIDLEKAACNAGGSDPSLDKADAEFKMPVIPPGPLEEATGNRIHMLAAVEFTTKYYYRGWLQENQGMIAQPLLRLDIDLWSDESNDILQKVGIVTGFRNSIHSRETMARDESLSIWYEADIVAGLRFEFLKGFSLEAKYVAITSPNDAWDTINEVDLDFAYNDAGKWGFYDFGINPTALYVIEFDGSAGGDPKGQYLELGIEPGMTVIPSMSFPLHLSFPVKVGLSMDNYYVFLPFGTDKDSTFGFAKVGVTLFLPLTFIPPQYGKWGVSAGFDVIVLGDNMEHFAGRNMDYIGRCGIGVKF